ncbi:hypothetical protein C8Q73DRAFT_643345 [Cubamyces lactineus]|nr:hypothetical protein C8Q73DRAFT_643345 [Cubamyces lactineus]
MFATIASIGYNTAHTAIAASGLCRLPLASHFPLCAKANEASSTSALSVGQADFPHLMAIQHRAFDQLLGQSSTGTELALNIKKAELTVQDLIVMVRTSNLTIKSVLSETLTHFVIDAKDSARGLQRLSSKIHGTLDSAIAFNTYALQEISDAKVKGRRAHVDYALAQTFQASMSTFAAKISQLIIVASETASSLDRLEEHLLNVHELCLHEAMATSFAREDLLWQLWTVLGGNRDQIRDLSRRSAILKKVQEYRAVAIAYISAAMHTLVVVDADLNELRERITASGVNGVPVEVQIESISRGIMRIQKEKLAQWRVVADGGVDRGRPMLAVAP